jgi:hypothetical protein
LPAKTFNLVQSAVFEVVLEKPAEDKVTYEKEPDWNLVPFSVRNDKYYSIGTAFAISKTELITAFHVINLAYESMVLDKYYVRDLQGNIFEIDQVTGGSNEKDFLIFTVKGKTFDQFFQFERNFKVGDPVFSIGNALGEGVVIRNGLILGTVPEEDSGRWDLLKSSADGNPGNSGGPLVTSDGKVVALVTALRENILYSTPSSVILDTGRSVLEYRRKNRFGHLLLANKYNSTFETRVSLPKVYTGVKDALRDAYIPYYNASMSALFKEAPEYLTGTNNAYLLNSTVSSNFISVTYVDPNDDQWKLAALNSNTQNLSDNGQLLHTTVSGINFYKIKKPTSAPIEQISADPRYIMDIILQNVRTERNLWNNNRYRILSYGEPSSTGSLKDSLGRTWITAYWVIGFDDEVQLMHILPLPNGSVVITARRNSMLLRDYQWDLQKLCDHVFPSYAGSFDEWEKYITLNKNIPDFLKNIKFERNRADQSFSLKCGPFSVRSDKNVLNWTDNSELYLAPSWYKRNNKLEFNIRRIIMNRDSRGKDFLVFFRNIKPDSLLGNNAMENWNDLVQKKFPFDEVPAISARENTGSIGTIITAGQPDPDSVFSLYLSMENPQNEENLSRRFNALKGGVSADW